MRVEDLDGERSRPELIDGVLADLEWLGLDWDGPVVLQSQGKVLLDAALADLYARGLAYPCTCTKADVRAAQSAPQAGDGELRYPGTCRDRWPSLEAAAREAGRPPALRFRVSPEHITVDDGFAPPATFDPSAEVGDFPVARASGLPAYQLAAVADDARAGVTEVVRGDDLLPSTARQMLLQRALGLPHPRWFHVPLVLDGEGRRLAKRASALSLAELRARGVDVRAIVGWAAQSAGQEVPPRVRASEVTAGFVLAKLPHTPVRLDAARLAALTEALP